MARWLLLLLLPWQSVQAEVYTGWFSNDAASGYDVVAYFSEGQATPGSEQFQSHYQGARWLFSSARHKQLFDQDPARYAPQYGGHCAWAMAEKGDKVSADPLHWEIVDGKLYLNYNARFHRKWQQDKAAMIERADRHWQQHDVKP